MLNVGIQLFLFIIKMFNRILLHFLKHRAYYLSRRRAAQQYYAQPLQEIKKWVYESRERTNFTYHLTPLNRLYLAHFISNITLLPVSTIKKYLTEIETDTILQQHIKEKTLKSTYRIEADLEARYGRRIGWYALVRALKPKVVIETGVDKGLGSCVLCAALLKNKSEGFEGEYFGTDINPNAGYLLDDIYKSIGKILYGDSIQSLQAFTQAIDLFINDSDHSHQYEANEYATIASKLSAYAYIISDNAHVSPELAHFAEKTGRCYHYFQEKPANHWYPGAGLGVAYYPNLPKAN